MQTSPSGRCDSRPGYSSAGVTFDSLLVPEAACAAAAEGGVSVRGPHNQELSAIGAAWLAGMELGWWKSFEELESIAQEADRFVPKMARGEREKLYRG